MKKALVCVEFDAGAWREPSGSRALRCCAPTRPRISPDDPDTAGWLPAGGEISPPDHQNHLGLWMERSGALVPSVRPRRQSSA